MGLFSSKNSEDEICKKYLATAPIGSRIDVLAAACAHQVRDLPVSTASSFGLPLTIEALLPASECVRGLLVQDRDLSGTTARKAMQHLHVVMSGFMQGSSYGENMDTALAAIGLLSEPQIHVSPEHRENLSSADADVAVAIANTALSVLRSLVLGAGEASPSEYQFYVALHTREGARDMEALAYDIIAWESVVLSRLLNTGRVANGLPTMASQYSRIPAMTEAGWYPNPNRAGDIVGGVASIQRLWNGFEWTEQVRIRQGKSWETTAVSLRSAPTD